MFPKVFFFLLIDPVINQYNGTTTAVSEDQIMYEPVLKKCKEEEDEYDINFGTEQKTSFIQTDDVCMDDIKVVVIGEVDVETASTSKTTASSEEMTAGKCEDSLSDSSTHQTNVISKESSSATMVSSQNNVW